MTVVLGEEALGVFRSHWDGPRLLDLVAEHGGQVLINWPIGVGKAAPSTGSSRPPSAPAVTISWWPCSPPAASWRNAPGSEPRRAD